MEDNAKRQVTGELLLACAGTTVDDRTRERTARLLGKDVDWDFLLKLARRHGLLPRLYRNLEAGFKDAIPAPVLEQLHRDMRTHRVRAWLLTAELVEILDELRNNGVRAIPYKGPILALQAYGDLALRQFTDLDLLIRAADMPLARTRLIAHGYQPYLTLKPSLEARYLRAQGHLPLVRRDGKILVELHVTVTPKAFGFPFDTEALWDRLTPVDVWGTAVPALVVEDQLLILCAHGAKHQWSSLGWIGDVDGLIRSNPDLNWPQLVRNAHQTNSVRMLALGLHLAHRLLETPLPPEQHAMTDQEPHVHELAAEIRDRLFTFEPHKPGLRAECRFIMRVRTRPRDGLRYYLSRVLSPTTAEWTSLPLPDSLSFVYYLFRPARLMVKYMWCCCSWGRWHRTDR